MQQGQCFIAPELPKEAIGVIFTVFKPITIMIFFTSAFRMPNSCLIISLLGLLMTFFPAESAAQSEKHQNFNLGNSAKITPNPDGFTGAASKFGRSNRYRLDAPKAGVTHLDFDNNGSVDLTLNISEGPLGEVLSWKSATNIVLLKLVAHGGTIPNVYDYSGTIPHPSSDESLHCAANEGGTYAKFKHIDFTFNFQLSVSKTAHGEFTRSYHWAIDKVCEGPSSLNLMPGQIMDYPFSWTTLVFFTDSDWKVSGEITVLNNTPNDATIESIEDILSGGETATLNCGVSFPFVLAHGEMLSCTYAVPLAVPYNGINTVTVVTSSPLVDGGSATAPFSFVDPSTEIDKCVTVLDDCLGPFQVCADDPYGKQYTCPVSFPNCGTYTYTNTAKFITHDTNNMGSDACTISVTVLPCDAGCTYTYGYWKTHSKYGPAPYDSTWALVGEDAPFFLSGMSWYEVAWTAPAGNAYYILAHQYLAAKLNFLNGASAPAVVQAAFDSATVLFNTYTPGQIGALGGNNPIRKQFVQLAEILDDYNNGKIGPGHCGEFGNDFAAKRNRAPVLGEFRIFPNPARDEVQVDLSDFIGQQARLMLYNQIGALVQDFSFELVTEGVFTMRLEGALPSGYYKLLFQSGEAQLTKSLILNK